MSRVKYITKLLLVLLSPVMLVVVAKAMHTIYMWVLAGIVPPQEVWYSAMVLTVVSFVIAGCYAFWVWIDEYV